MSLNEALALGQAELVTALGQWSQRNPDANIRVWMLGLTREQRRKVESAYWVAFHCPIDEWVTGP